MLSQSTMRIIQRKYCRNSEASIEELFLPTESVDNNQMAEWMLSQQVLSPNGTLRCIDFLKS